MTVTGPVGVGVGAGFAASPASPASAVPSALGVAAGSTGHFAPVAGLSAGDLARIRQTLAAFAHVFDNQDVDLLHLVFTEDGVIELTRGAGSVKRGLAEIAAFATSLPVGGLDHQTLDTVVFVGDDGVVRARSRYLAILADQSIHNGDYLDELVRTEAGWRIARRISVPRIPRGEQVALSEGDRAAWRLR